MLQRLASSLALAARRLQPDRLRVLLQLEAAPQLEGKAATSAHTLLQWSSFSSSSTASSRLLGGCLQQQVLQPLGAQLSQASAVAQVLRQPLPLAAAATAAMQPAQQQLHWQQWQQQRGLLGVRNIINYQDHNQKKPPKYKIKTTSSVKRRVIVGEDGTMWRMQAGRRHKRYKKSRQRLLGLKGLVPLHHAETAKLRKLGYKRRWWFAQKA
ncbi:hypothetical protein OEZ86_009660 [Tetradesmus obliquus]|uniref:50S ribosomal protein L35 n=1 Tax=Tetradesmus obliquus TaxID=3088 RepID=A0ABY8UQZ6_TETOB|nr:hypothetical protein OEZ85_001104 [Tetradesmus obliquus]WIA43147.1 hypothetical protein OEZ86_009660 [Tetradesmus obliquus]